MRKLNIVIVFDDFVYIMYIFGLIGKLKGVMIFNWNVVLFVLNSNYLLVGMMDCFILIGFIGFDVVMFEIFGVFLNGVCFYVVDCLIMFVFERFGSYFFVNCIMILFLIMVFFN